MIKLNPEGIAEQFVFVCDAIASWWIIPPDLQQQFHEILHAFRAQIGDRWPAYFGSFPEHVKKTLHEHYGL